MDSVIYTEYGNNTSSSSVIPGVETYAQTNIYSKYVIPKQEFVCLSVCFYSTKGGSCAGYNVGFLIINSAME